MDNTAIANRFEDVEFGVGTANDGTPFVVLRVTGVSVAFPAAWTPAVVSCIERMLADAFERPEGEALN